MKLIIASELRRDLTLAGLLVSLVSAKGFRKGFGRSLSTTKETREDRSSGVRCPAILPILSPRALPGSCGYAELLDDFRCERESFGKVMVTGASGSRRGGGENGDSKRWGFVAVGDASTTGISGMPEGVPLCIDIFPFAFLFSNIYIKKLKVEVYKNNQLYIYKYI